LLESGINNIKLDAKNSKECGELFEFG